MRILAFVTGGVSFFVGCAPPPAPAQPIAFSHRLHAGAFQIQCLFCHDGARRSPVAGVPPVERCLACHAHITSKSPEIQKLKTYGEQERPVPWIRIHRLPDFTRFNHRRHVASGVSCEHCHGPVQTMDEVRRVSSLEMGWCLDCHKKRAAPEDCLTCHH